MDEKERSLGQRACLCAIRGYRRYISPILPDSCIYTPTCSEYTYQAIAKYGAPRGILMGAKRIWRCNPFREGGYDPVP